MRSFVSVSSRPKHDRHAPMADDKEGLQEGGGRVKVTKDGMRYHVTYHVPGRVICHR